METDLPECYKKEVNRHIDLEFDHEEVIKLLEKLSGMMIIVPDKYRAAIYFAAKIIRRLTKHGSSGDDSSSGLVKSLKAQIKRKDDEIDKLKAEVAMCKIALKNALEMLEHSDAIKGMLKNALDGSKDLER